MATGASAGEVVAVIRASWPTRPPTDGFVLRGARPLDDAIEVAFDWRADPQRYLVRFAHPAFVEEIRGIGHTAEEAAAELSFWMMEELDTGFASRARRTPVPEGVLLEPGLSRPTTWFVGRVPLLGWPDPPHRHAGTWWVDARYDAPSVPIAHPGGHLVASALDPAAGRAAVADGSLIAWLQVDRGLGGARRDGQAVVSRSGPDTGRIVRIEAVPGAFDVLAWAACRSAVEAGCRVVTAAVEIGRLRGFGFQERGGLLVARFDELHEPAGPAQTSGAPPANRA